MKQKQKQNNEFGTSSKKIEIETKEPILITKITLEKAEEKVELNHTKTLKYKVEPENVTNKNLKWELSDNEIATVENGETTGIKIGNCTITATEQDSGKVSTTCTIKVVNCNADNHSNWGVVHMKDCYFSGELIAGSWQHSPTSYGYDKVGISQGCYYNSDCYGQEYSNSNVTALTTAQFADKNNFGNWDFENTWIMKDGHPELRIFIDKK